MNSTTSRQYAELPLSELVVKFREAYRAQRFECIEALLPYIDIALNTEGRTVTWALALAWRAKITIALHGNYIQGLEDALKAFYFFREMNDESRMIASCIDIGNCYLFFALYDQAVEQLSTAYLLAEKLGRHDGMAVSLMMIAMCYSRMNNAQEAVKMYADALDIAEKNGLDGTASDVRTALCTAYVQLKRFDDALATIIEAIKAKTERKDMRGLEVAYENESAVYMEKKEFGTALKIIHKSEQLLKQLPPNPVRLAQVSLNKSICLCESGKIKQALSMMQKILAIYEKNNALAYMQKAHEVLAYMYSLLGNTSQSRKHEKNAAELSMICTGEELQQKVRALTVAFDVQRYQSEAQLERERALRLEAELQAKEKELTILALNLAQKNEMLAGIENKLHSLEKTLNSARKGVRGTMTSLINNVKSDIASSVSSDKSWDVFEQQFTSIHPGFMERLSRKYPIFKPMELRLCALLRVNLSTKQIAGILCIDSGSVDVYRSRIRKKIGLDRSDNLMAYLAAI